MQNKSNYNNVHRTSFVEIIHMLCCKMSIENSLTHLWISTMAFPKRFSLLMHFFDIYLTGMVCSREIHLQFLILFSLRKVQILKKKWPLCINILLFIFPPFKCIHRHAHRTWTMFCTLHDEWWWTYCVHGMKNGQPD